MRPTVCRYEHFQSDWYERSRSLLKLPPASEPPLVGNWRKSWEWAAIVETLLSHDMLRSGRKGLGFAVGTEPLAALFANRGVDVLATDLADGGAWGAFGQHARNLHALFHPELVTRPKFNARVRFEHADMNDLDELPRSAFDFLWSSCAIEHVGSLKQSVAFVKNAMHLLRSGGIAVHTTEFNCSSNEDTIEAGPNIIFRRRDIEELGDELRVMRCGMAAPDFDCGVHRLDLDYDEPPYFESGRPHLKLLLDGYVSTSFLIVVHKA